MTRDPHAAYSTLLMIVPRSPAEPLVIDEATRKMTAAWRQREDSDYSWRGFHVCICGVASDNHDHWVGDEMLTNSLCVHYLAFHRSAVPPDQIAQVLALAAGEVEPTEDEFRSPKRLADARL